MKADKLEMVDRFILLTVRCKQWNLPGGFYVELYSRERYQDENEQRGLQRNVSLSPTAGTMGGQEVWSTQKVMATNSSLPDLPIKPNGRK